MPNWKTASVGAIAGICAGWRVLKTRQTARNAKFAAGKRFVILGAGFGGFEAARELARQLPDLKNGEIVLVDKHEYSLFTPMLTQAVGGEIEPHHIIIPAKRISRRIRFLPGEVRNVDLNNRTVELDNPGASSLIADHLIIALGAVTNYHHIPGVENAAIPMKTIDDAYRIRQSALSLMKAAARESNAEERAAMLTFVVAGGGYTGVETIAALNDMLRDEIVKFANLDATELRMLLVEPLDRLMTEITADLATYAQAHLERAGIRVALKTGIKAVNGDSIELTTGETVRSRTLIWTAGVEPNPLIEKLNAPKVHKALQVDNALAVPGYPGVWAIGDCAAIPKPDGRGDYEMTAQNATREGIHVARNVLRAINGLPKRAFCYTPVGELALVGRRRAVARVYGYNFSGFPAWCMWRAVYIAKLPSMTQRLRVLSDWVLDLLLGPVAEYHYASMPPRRFGTDVSSIGR
jgi:NADH dehydrogenase